MPHARGRRFVAAVLGICLAVMLSADCMAHGVDPVTGTPRIGMDHACCVEFRAPCCGLAHESTTLLVPVSPAGERTAVPYVLVPMALPAFALRARAIGLPPDPLAAPPGASVILRLPVLRI
ncbi:MAG: hypothetical protein FJW23_11755 [Acidimicrobiia bacterium]|nr:hypothetical protein [Acidimicrobiia bacterium]